MSCKVFDPSGYRSTTQGYGEEHEKTKKREFDDLTPAEQERVINERAAQLLAEAAKNGGKIRLDGKDYMVSITNADIFYGSDFAKDYAVSEYASDGATWGGTPGGGGLEEVIVTGRRVGGGEGFDFRVPINGGRIANSSHNLNTTLADFFDGGSESSWVFGPGHEVSQRMLDHPFISDIYGAYLAGGAWRGNYAKWSFDQQYTAYFGDFLSDAANALGFYGEGFSHGDFGTNILGSFNVRGQIIFDGVSNTKAINLDIYNSFTGGSMLRNPITRASGPSLGLA